MPHAVRGRVAYAQLPLQFFGAYAVPGIAEKEDRIEPMSKGNLGAFEGRSRKRVELVPTVGALKGFAALHGVEIGLCVTLRAMIQVPVSQVPNLLQTGFVGRVSFEKLRESEFHNGGFLIDYKVVTPLDRARQIVYLWRRKIRWGCRCNDTP